MALSIERELRDRGVRTISHDEIFIERSKGFPFAHCLAWQLLQLILNVCDKICRTRRYDSTANGINAKT